MSYKTAEGINGKFLLSNFNETIDSNDTKIPLDSWFYFDSSPFGHYIVDYDDFNWKLIITALQTDHHSFSPSDRAKLILDASLLAQRELLSYNQLFNLLNYIKNDDDLIPWMTASKVLLSLSELLSASNGGVFIRDYIKDLSKNLYYKIGFNGTKINEWRENFHKK